MGINVKRRRLAVAALIVAGTAGCATTNFRTEPLAFAGGAPVEAIYIYSFLDVRESQMGPNFLREVRTQLAEALKLEGVRSAHLSFNDSPVRGEHALNAEPRGGTRSSTRIPVGDVVAANEREERAFGAPYRMIIFPASVTALSTGHRFDIRWDIYDTRTDRRVWTATSESLHQNWASADESPVERGKTLVEGILGQMRKAGVLRRKA